MTTLICDCNQTMPLQPQGLGAVLHEKLTLHSSLCRRQAGAFVQALASGDDVVLACTQEQRLFGELAEQAAASPGASMATVRFVNIRETGGWSKDASQASPKIAALLAAAHLPEPQPVATVSYKSAGRTLIIGELGAAERAAELLGDGLDITLFTLGAGEQGGLQQRRYPVLGGKILSLTGWLGAFEFTWLRNNPIDLDLCTRCNACVAACPEDAIGLDYQIDLKLCRSHRACARVCQAAGAIDFHRTPEPHSETLDLVLDLRAAPAFGQHALPQGYLRWDGHNPQPLLQLRALVGEFEKPKFFAYNQKLCAHSRNEKIGCSACIDVCSAGAIRSDFSRQQISVNAHLCIGCGTCSTVCPSGAIGFSYPRASEQGVRIKTMLGTYARSGGHSAALLLHSQQRGAQLLGELGRAAQLERASPDGTHGVPARVLPLALWHTSSLGIEVWLSSICHGASQVWVLLTDEEAPQYLDAIRAQMEVAQSIMSGLGYQGEHFRVLQARDARDLAALDRELQAAPAQCVDRVASFAWQQSKRATLELALEHLVDQAPRKAEQAQPIALPATGSPLGALKLSKDACTLCLSCVNACPSGALLDNPASPQLRFIERNCVQCGLCVATCPEKALALAPQLNLAATRKQAVVIHEMAPYACVRCGQPFGTLKAVQAMLGKLADHSMFQGAALERLKMCADCRVIDIHSGAGETRITDL